MVRRPHLPVVRRERGFAIVWKSLLLCVEYVLGGSLRTGSILMVSRGVDGFAIRPAGRPIQGMGVLPVPSVVSGRCLLLVVALMGAFLITLLSFAQSVRASGGMV